MADELSAFRKLAIKVYETMTQDVSDVLTNEHAQLINYYNEQRNNFRNKMMRAIDEIHEICPDFDFDAYFMDKPGYIAKKFPLPEEVNICALFLFTHYYIFVFPLVRNRSRRNGDEKTTSDLPQTSMVTF